MIPLIASTAIVFGAMRTLVDVQTDRFLFGVRRSILIAGTHTEGERRTPPAPMSISLDRFKNTFCRPALAVRPRQLRRQWYRGERTRIQYQEKT